MLNNLGFSRISVEDTAGAAQLVASKSMRETGAIASARAAKLYGLDIIQERIQDDLNNVTRFLILDRQPIIRGPIDRIRDIKCANILVDANGSVKLADFGLAKEELLHLSQGSCLQGRIMLLVSEFLAYADWSRGNDYVFENLGKPMLGCFQG